MAPTWSGWWTLLVPVLGPLFAGGYAPTFDDVEKMLQLFGLVSALILSVVAGSASYDDQNPNSKTIQGRAYSAFGFCVVSIVHVLIVYIYLVTTVDQETDKAKKQMAKWWFLGKLNLLLQVAFIVMALIEYTTFVNSTLINGYEPDMGEPMQYGRDNYFGFFVWWPGITYAIGFAILTAHSFAVPVILYNDDLRRQEEVTKRRADEAPKPNSQQEVDGPDDDDHSIRLGASL